MILCNLQSILTEHHTNVSKVSRDTGISRTTLTSLCSNNCQGVQLDTVNTLCKYFDIGIEKLFLFSKYDFYVRSDMPYLEIENFPQSDQGGYRVIIEYSGRKVECDISCIVYLHYKNNYINWIEVDLELWEDDNYQVEENRVLRKALSELQAPFKAWLRKEIESKIYYDYDEFLIDGYELTINYPQEFK